MSLFSFLSKFLISRQILIGFVPVLLVLAFLVYTSYQNFNTFSSSFDRYSGIANETLTIVEIEKDMVELQRNVLVYSYFGYGGVLRKIEFLKKELEEKFDVISVVTERDEQINDRFQRLLGHYHDYQDQFAQAVNKKTVLKELNSKQLQPLNQLGRKIIADLEIFYENAERFQEAHLISKIEADFIQVDLNIKAFELSPDASLISDTRRLITQMRENALSLQTVTGFNDKAEDIDEFIVLLDKHQLIFQEIIIVNRVYLHLVNVVLAGKAAEIAALSHELHDMFIQRSQLISDEIDDDVVKSNKNSLILSIIASVIAILSAIVIAIGIAKPVNAMASTLSQLARRKLNIEIPGQDRNDEVGEMARAANEFKAMAEDLEHQSQELEEFAYRTSHDLRSPLVSSIGLLKVVESSIQQGNQERAEKGLGLVQNSLVKLEALVKDILALTRTKNANEDIQSINFDEIVEQALAKFTHMENYDRLDIQKDLRFNGELVSKQSRVILIIENLISNAIKYQNLEELNPFIKVSNYQEDDQVVIVVEDNGIRIPSSQQNKLFTMFGRFHPKVSYGSGLGLYMMKKSIDVLGGSVAFKDTGNGSVFKFRIPL